MTYGTQVSINDEPVWYIREADDSLDIPKRLRSFQQFFRRHSEQALRP